MKRLNGYHFYNNGDSDWGVMLMYKTDVLDIFNITNSGLSLRCKCNIINGRNSYTYIKVDGVDE